MNKEILRDIICQSSSDYEILDNIYNYIEKLEKEKNQLEKEVERLKEREKLVTEHYNVMVRHAGNLEGKIIQLETNWNELKEWLRVCLEENNKIRLYDNNSYQAGEINTLENVIDKMQELERGKE